MKKAAVFICLIFIMSLSHSVSAEGFVGANVSIRIESYDETLFSEGIYSYTFADALKLLSNNGFINTQVDASGENISVYSINRIENSHFGGEDKWFCYIERDGAILRDNIMNAPLKNGDALVVYYGDAAKTQILSEFRHEINDNEIKFFAGAKSSVWKQENGKWLIDDSIAPVEGVRINLKLPSGNIKVLRTGSDGYAKTTISTLGVYTYKAGKYNYGNVPSIVASDKYCIAYGITDEAGITRGEAAAFIVSTFRIKINDAEAVFEDVQSGQAHFKEIMAAYEAGIIAGKGDGTFQPDEKIDLKSFCVMLSNAYKSEPRRIVEYKDVPQWALAGVNVSVQAGFINNITPDWNGSVSQDMLIKIYINIRGKTDRTRHAVN